MSDSTVVLTLNVPDISCEHCVTTVNTAVSSVDGVKHVNASAETKTVEIALDTDKTDESAIRDALERAGYPAT